MEVSWDFSPDLTGGFRNHIHSTQILQWLRYHIRRRRVCLGAGLRELLCTAAAMPESLQCSFGVNAAVGFTPTLGVSLGSGHVASAKGEWLWLGSWQWYGGMERGPLPQSAPSSPPLSWLPCIQYYLAQESWMWILKVLFYIFFYTIAVKTRYKEVN